VINTASISYFSRIFSSVSFIVTQDIRELATIITKKQLISTLKTELDFKDGLWYKGLSTYGGHTHGIEAYCHPEDQESL
jgi:hypothetical protein